MQFTLGPRAASAGYRLAAFDQIGSTNAEAMARARDGERGPIWFVTSEQTAGRGRRNRPWIAPRGNLASSIMQAMDVVPAVAATLGFAAGVAAEAALRRASIAAPGASTVSQPTFALKWPNDVLADGKKIVGINVEAEAAPGGGLAVVVGIGTNVVAAPEGTPTPATSLAGLGIEVRAEEVFVALSDAWAEFRGIWDDGRGFGEIRKAWLGRAAGLGETVAINTGSSVIEGIFDTIDEQGCMIVRTSGGNSMPVSAGDVYFGSAASIRAG
jgi:BirA family biotin operon repressor/biotin-[acetyl-CoA-carboxylase] ligase